MRKRLVPVLAILLLWCGFVVTVHASEHLFHQHVALCDIAVSAENNDACLPAPVVDQAPPGIAPLSLITHADLALQAPRYLSYLCRAPPLSRQ